jgi:putative peptide zinc metalloprotease protein
VRRRAALLLLALVAGFGTAQAHADDGDQGGGGGANQAIAINQQDGSNLFKFAFAVRHVLGDTVDQENAAVAYASCESCQTTAIAIEIVLVEGHPATVAPQNVAVAVNDSCTLCDTFATAYQFVIGTNGPVRFTHDGIKELHRIRKEIESWGKQGLTNDQIRALLPDVVQRIKNVLATELVPVGGGGDEDHRPGTTTTAQPNAPPTTTAPGTETVPTTTTTPPETGTTATTTTEPSTTTTTTPTTTPATTTTP